MTIEVIESPDGASTEMVHRVPSAGSGEFQLGAQVIVRESQVAVFYRDGRSMDTFGPGRHTLSTLNLPIVGKAVTSRVFGQSPFKAEVYFVNRNIFAGIKWGTRDPIAYRDQELSVVRLRAHGEFAVRIVDPLLFVNTVVGARGVFTSKDIEGFLKSMVVSSLSQVIGETLTSIFDLPVRYDDLAIATRARVLGEFKEYGSELVSLVIESITPPTDVQKRIDERSGIGAVGDLDSYLRYKTALAVEEAAAHSGTSGNPMGAAVAFGLGMSTMRATQDVTAVTPHLDGKCVTCTSVIPSGSRFCPGCGTELARVNCPNCRQHLLPGAQFCSSCGSPRP